jgi:hypothetical protein
MAYMLHRRQQKTFMLERGATYRINLFPHATRTGLRPLGLVGLRRRLRQRMTTAQQDGNGDEQSDEGGEECTHAACWDSAFLRRG